MIIFKAPAGVGEAQGIQEKIKELESAEAFRSGIENSNRCLSMK